MMELFKGYVSLGVHLASEGIPRLPKFRQGLMATYQAGARNIYYEESATRSVDKLHKMQQILANQPKEGKSILRAKATVDGGSEQRFQAVMHELAAYRSYLDKYGPSKTSEAVSSIDPEIETALFTVAEYEMLDTLPPTLAVEFTSEAFTPDDLTKSMALYGKYDRLDKLTKEAIMYGNVNQGLDIGRTSLITLGKHLRFRNPRIVDTWGEYRNQAVDHSLPTRVGSRFGLGHFSFRDRLPSDEWVFEYDFDPSLIPPTYRLAVACEFDPKRVPTDNEVFSVLLERIVDARFHYIDATNEVKFSFLQQLLKHCTPPEIKKLVRKLPQGSMATFDHFVKEKGIKLPTTTKG